MKKSFFTVTCTFLSLIGGIRAQESEDIGTETVTVVKPYAPTVSDAFKLKSVPQLNDSVVTFLPLCQCVCNYARYRWLLLTTSFRNGEQTLTQHKKAGPNEFVIFPCHLI